MKMKLSLSSDIFYARIKKRGRWRPPSTSQWPLFLTVLFHTSDVQDAGTPCSWTSILQLSLVRHIQDRL